MADTPISGLPDGTLVQTTDQIPVTRGTSNFRVQVGALAPLDNVSNARLEDDAVSSGKIQNNAVITGKILNNQVTLAKIQDINSGEMLGRQTAGSGDPQALAPVDARAVMEVPAISSEDELTGPMKLAVVATLPGTPDSDTIYFVTT